MKRILTLILVLVLALTAFVGCDKIQNLLPGKQCDHNYANGVCGNCGESDPNYVPPHTHNYVEGKCECGAEDPDFVPTPEVDENLQAAYDFVHQYHKSVFNTGIMPDAYSLLKSVLIEGVSYSVTWSASVENVSFPESEDGSSYVAKLPKLDADLAYVLKFTVANAEGDTLERSYNLTVPKFEVLTYEQFLATKDDAAVAVSGVVSGIVETAKENDLYLQTEGGAYFVFKIEKKPSELGIKNGMTVLVCGQRDTYYDVPQVVNASVEILDSTIKTVTPVDMTEAFTNAPDVLDDHFVQYFNQLVTIKGVSVLGQSTKDPSYYNFALGTKETYVRISSSTCMFSSEKQEIFKQNVKDHINWTADVTGFVTNYNGNIYLIPLDENAFSNFKEAEISDEAKVNFEFDRVTFSDVHENGVLNLPVVGATYSDVVLSWESDNACAVVDNAAGTLTVTRTDKSQTVKLTVTLSLGNVTKTKVIEINVDGKIFDGTANLTADNMGLGEYAEGSVTVEGIEFGYTELGSYGDGIQMRIKEGRVATLFNLTELPYGIKYIELVFSANKSTYDNADALKFCFGNDANVSAYTVNLSTVKGTKTYTITPDVNTYTYFSIELLLTYSFYWDEINIVLDKPVEEHTCNFSEATCTQKATCSICGATQGELLDHNYDSTTHACTCGKEDPNYYWEMSIADALQTVDGKKVKLHGVVSSIKSEWSEQYGNMEVYLSDGNGNEIHLFRISTKVAVGDELIVEGEIDIYKEQYQIKQGSTVTVVSNGQGGSTPDTHEHTFVEGKCECGETDPNYQPPAGDDDDDYGVMSIPEVLASAEGTAVIVKGTVCEIYQAWSDQYSNISFYIKDDAGNKLLVFRTGTKVSIGDQVTVTGKATVYNGTIQIAQGGTTVVDVAHVCSEFTTGSCTTDSYCVVCEKVATKAPGHNYVNGTCDKCGAAEPQGDVLPGNLVFTNLANKASADSYLKTNFPEWSITGKLGNGYAGYLGFGRSGDSKSSITSSEISISSAFTVTTVIKGNGSEGVMTSTLTFTLIDKDGNTIATGYANGSTTAAITPVDAKDTTYNISFTFVDGKTWTDVSNLVVSFSKATGNIGLKSLDFVQ